MAFVEKHSVEVTGLLLVLRGEPAIDIPRPRL